MMSRKPAPERIQKVLAHAGVASRREIERWIEAGRVKINDQVVKIGDRMTTGDKVSIDGKLVNIKKSDKQGLRLIAYNKPVGEICSRKDDKARKTVFENLPRLRQGRWINVGRLDVNTSGLLLFTNDGELANRLMHPSTEIDREYAVRVRGKVNREILEQLRTGVELEDGMARFTDIVDSGGESSNHWYHVVLMEGRTHEVKRLWESQGIQVSRLIRVRYGPIILPRHSKPGSVRQIKGTELKTVLDWVGMG